jgi:hypothetical protein
MTNTRHCLRRRAEQCYSQSNHVQLPVQCSTVTSTQFSIAAASRRTGKSRTTIIKHIRQGKLSVTVDSQGNKVLEASELMRVYGDDFKLVGEEGSRSEPGRQGAGKPLAGDQGVQALLHSVQQQLDTVNKERERERTQLESRIDSLEEALKRSQEAQNKALLLLENRSGGGEWQAAIKALEEKIANREKTNEARKETVKNIAKQEAIDELKSKPWWQAMYDLAVHR